MSDTIVGRAGELTSVERFLDEILLGPSALSLQGEAGAGKTTVLRATISAARERGYRVLACHPAESESSLAFAALGDLLEGVLDQPHPTLPAPQYRALKVAVLMADPDGLPPDQRSVSVATLGVLKSLAQHSPVLVAIDDLQWMDPASGRVLEFALRRLEAERVGVVITARPAAGRLPITLDRGFWVGEPRVVALAPLGPDALDSICRNRLGVAFPRSVLTEIAAASGGNPLFALEIARGILRGEIAPKPGEQLAVPRMLHELVRDRLENLPADVRDLLFVAAAVSDPTIALLERAAEHPGRVRAGVDVAAQAGTVEVVGDRLRFTHPLFASTLYHAISVERRRVIHASLAHLVSDSVERARHLALAADGPDAPVAAALDEAARATALRGAPDAAAELSEQAYALTPHSDEGLRLRRRIDVAEYHFAAGNPALARRWLEEIVTALDAGPGRASVLRRLAKVRYRNDSCSVAAQLLTRALQEAGGDATLKAGIGRDLAWAVTLCGDVRDAAEHARSALQLVEQTGDAEVLAELLAATSMTDFLLGGGVVSSDAMHRSLELERLRPEVPIEWRPSMMLGMMLKWSGDLHGAGRVFDTLHQRTREAAEETSLPFLLSQMSETATWSGDWVTALGQAKEANTIALQTGQELIRSSVLYTQALVEAHLGLVDEARASAYTGLELAKSAGSVLAMMLNQTVLGFLELSVDNAAVAHGYLAPLVTWAEVVGIREPGVLRFVPDEVEALVALGQLEKADELLRAYEADAARLERTWAILAGARCRALHTAASGDSRGAHLALKRTLELTGANVPPFERARAQLVLGSIQRRTRQRKEARETLGAALETFERLGAQLWSAKAGRLLATGAGQIPGQLTPAELRVAELVAGGATNREAADQLFVSVRAVEVHLTSIYRKLGIRSRTELARRIAPGETT